MLFKILCVMMGITSTLLLIKDARHRAQLRRIYKHFKTIIENGKESEKRQTEEKEGSDHD
jgi:hypothetical protein